jgi:hypothetical protein
MIMMDDMLGQTVDLAQIEAAAERIAGRVRRTPTIAAEALKAPPGPWDLRLKLECLQVTGSFKPRGAANKLLSLSDQEVRRGIITASGGNHGLGVAYAGWQAGTRTVIYLPASTSADKVAKIKAWGAETVIEGAVWDEANQAAMKRAESDGLTYIHPFADPAVIAGQGTTGLELLSDVPDCDASPSAAAASSPASPRRPRRSSPKSRCWAWNRWGRRPSRRAWPRAAWSLYRRSPPPPALWPPDAAPRSTWRLSAAPSTTSCW